MTRAGRILIAGLLGAMASGPAGAVVTVTPRDDGRPRPRPRPSLQDTEIRWGNAAHRPQGQRERERRLRQRAKGQLRGRGIDGP